MNLQLFIEGKQIEFFEDEYLTLKRAVKDIKTLGKAFTPFLKILVYQHQKVIIRP